MEKSDTDWESVAFVVAIALVLCTLIAGATVKEAMKPAQETKDTTP
jgi:Na+-transporting NADH:ubiquinone oxidoreductase subunit NqrC